MNDLLVMGGDGGGGGGGYIHEQIFSKCNSIKKESKTRQLKNVHKSL